MADVTDLTYRRLRKQKQCAKVGHIWPDKADENGWKTCAKCRLSVNISPSSSTEERGASIPVDAGSSPV